MKSKYPKLQNGEAIQIDLGNEDFKFACCDCGLVHTFQFYKIKKNIWDFAIFRDKRATGQLRRHKFGYLQ